MALDSVHFPPFRACPEENSISLDYYTTHDGFYFVPSQHWCLLAEIVSVEYFLRLRLILRDHAGTEFPLAFHLDDETEFDHSAYQIGYTAVILYPHQHGFMDFTIGIRQEQSNTIMVIPTSLLNVFNLAGSIANQICTPGSDRRCDSCTNQASSLLRCGRCLSCWYCNKDCQRNSWLRGGHKQSCNNMRIVRNLLHIPWDDFKNYLRFPL